MTTAHQYSFIVRHADYGGGDSERWSEWCANLGIDIEGKCRVACTDNSIKIKASGEYTMKLSSCYILNWYFQVVNDAGDVLQKITIPEEMITAIGVRVHYIVDIQCDVNLTSDCRLQLVYDTHDKLTFYCDESLSQYNTSPDALDGIQVDRFAITNFNMIPTFRVPVSTKTEQLMKNE